LFSQMYLPPECVNTMKYPAFWQNTKNPSLKNFLEFRLQIGRALEWKEDFKARILILFIWAVSEKGYMFQQTILWKEGIMEFENIGLCHLKEASSAVQKKQALSYTSNRLQYTPTHRINLQLFKTLDLQRIKRIRTAKRKHEDFNSRLLGTIVTEEDSDEGEGDEKKELESSDDEEHEIIVNENFLTFDEAVQRFGRLHSKLLAVDLLDDGLYFGLDGPTFKFPSQLFNIKVLRYEIRSIILLQGTYNAEGYCDFTIQINPYKEIFYYVDE
ncbi:8109_t:CDS:2, partial [Scutellospora calospora]